MIHSWRKHGHGRIVGAAHSTVRFWDLRYFCDARDMDVSLPCPLPAPDLVALNGSYAVKAHLEAGYPPHRIAECEALRYGYLETLIKSSGRHAVPREGRLRVLVLGDYSGVCTIRMMKLLAGAYPSVRDMEFVVKPHPNFMIRAEDYPEMVFTVVTQPLGELLLGFDVAYCSNMTSAAVDARLAGLPVIVMLDDEEVNFSPLRGIQGVRFVSAPKELSDALREANDCGTEQEADLQDFFFLDERLIRWKRLLGLEDSRIE